jgi:amino acid adenylation domain-containing protein
MNKQNKKMGDSEQILPISPVSRDSHLPLSFAQQRIWFLDQLEGPNSTYNIPIAFRLTGQLDIHAVQQCIDRVVQRHEVLRTTFQAVEGSAIQVIADQMPMPVELVNLEELDETEQIATVQRLLGEEVKQLFDLATGKLLRMKVLRLATEEHILLVTMHHIISDGWSIGVLVREVMVLYQAYLTGIPDDLPELAIQYVDFSHWQRQRLQGEVLQTQLAYWKEQLKGVPPLLELPTDRPRPTVQSFQGRLLDVSITPELTEQLRQLSRKSGATLFMTLLSAFKVLLYRYSGQPDIVVGSGIANRNRREIEGLIGFFFNTLVLRTLVDGQESFEQLLEQVRQVTLDAYAHQDLPFIKLVEELQPERNLSYNPLFQVAFELQDAPEALEMQDLQLEPLGYEWTNSKFDLTLSLKETDEGLIGSWEYNTDLFDTTTIERMAGHFQTLLVGIVANAELSIAQLPLLTENERRQLLVEWNDTATEFPSELCVHQLFEQQVKQTPEAIALVFEEQQLTYRELNQKANQLAHHLQALDVGPEVLVGICLERSLEMVVGLLGILKAGGAYIPLDPTYPAERLSFMLMDSQARMLITHSSLADNLPSSLTQVILLDELEAKQLVHLPQNDLVSRAHAENLAYIMYTSGSTGTPKGVMIEHRSIVRLVKNNPYIDFSPPQVFLQLAPITFDASTFELWGPLLNGNRLALASPGRISLNETARLLQQQQVSTLWLTAGLFQLMVEHQLEAFKPVKQLLAGGDVLQASSVRRVLQRWPHLRLVNGYGPTEATTFSCTYTVPTDEETNVPIGRPIANTHVYVLDERMQPVPIGVVGEIYIGGTGVARGYLNRLELTAEKFIADSFSNFPNTRLYRTGDLGRYLMDGNLEYIGRIDNQVKLRGFRIELGEIEAALSEHPQVQQAIVVMHSDSGNSKRLVGYVVATQDEQISVGTLREYLQTKLPEYIVPSFFMVLKEVPLTPNGKIDRNALPQPQILHAETQIAARTPSEELLAGLWLQALGLEQIGIHDDFFESGGHSLLATQLVSRIGQVFSIELPMRTLFEQPTIAQLAQVIENMGD